MIYGHFFKLDRDSRLDSGQVIFRYLPVTCKSSKGKREYPYYPVYAVIGPHAIDFFYHGKDEEDKKSHRHVHTRLLHLPLSLNLSIKDNLTSILQDNVYNAKYKISPEQQVDSKDNSTKTYWDLDVFRQEKPKKSEKPSKTEICFRKLLLDFIYDLEHTHVFENSPYYEEAEVRLRENFLFNAIAAKAAYYLARQNWEKSKENDENVQKTQNIYAEKLAETEKQWLKILRSEQSCDYCSYSAYSGGWFKKVENEYKQVIFNSQRYQWRKELEQATHKNEGLLIIRESIHWFLRRYNFCSAVKILWNFSNERKMVFILSTLSGLGVLLYVWPINDDQHLFMKLSVYFLVWLVWLLVMFPLTFALKFALPAFGMLMPRLIMAISSAWIVFTTTEELYKSSFNVTFSTGWWVLILLLPVILFMMLEIHNIAPDVKPCSIFVRCIGILGIGLLYSFIIGLFFINFTAKNILPRSGYLQTFYHELDIKDWNNPYVNSNKIIAEVKSQELYNNLKNVYPVSLKWMPILVHVKIFSVQLDLLPRMLIFRAFFALFIGVFIQLIFEEKPITEPL